MKVVLGIRLSAILLCVFAIFASNNAFAVGAAPASPKLPQPYLLQCKNAAWLSNQHLPVNCVDYAFGLYRIASTEDPSPSELQRVRLVIIPRELLPHLVQLLETEIPCR